MKTETPFHAYVFYYDSTHAWFLIEKTENSNNTIQVSHYAGALLIRIINFMTASLMMKAHAAENKMPGTKYETVL